MPKSTQPVDFTAEGGEEKTFRRMGLELGVLRDLAIEILCDSSYQRLMTKQIWGSLGKACDLVDRVRSRAEDRMFSKYGIEDLLVFYPTNHRLRADIVSEIRAKCAEERR